MLAMIRRSYESVSQPLSVNFLAFAMGKQEGKDFPLLSDAQRAVVGWSMHSNIAELNRMYRVPTRAGEGSFFFLTVIICKSFFRTIFSKMFF